MSPGATPTRLRGCERRRSLPTATWRARGAQPSRVRAATDAALHDRWDADGRVVGVHGLALGALALRPRGRDRSGGGVGDPDHARVHPRACDRLPLLHPAADPLLAAAARPAPGAVAGGHLASAHG